MLLNLVLWVAGVVLIVLGALRVQGPLVRYRELKSTEANLARYDSWRGGRRTGVDQGVTGAQVMLGMLRAQIQRWGIVLVAGVALVIVGFVIR